MTEINIIERMRDDISDLKSTTKVILSKVDTLSDTLAKHADREDKDRVQIIEMLLSKADRGDLVRLESEKNRILSESQDIHERMFSIMENKQDKTDAKECHKDIYLEIERINGNIIRSLWTALFAAISAIGTMAWELILHFIAK